MVRAICVIPSRYGSVRLPGKPLIDIAGKPLIQRVFEQAAQAKRIERVLVATDDERIKKAVEDFGGEAVLSPPSLPTGSDRVARVLEDLKLDHDIIMNLQGDEPLIDPKDLDRLIECFERDNKTDMASLMAPLHNEEDVLNPNQVKVVVNHENFALYFSRRSPSGGVKKTWNGPSGPPTIGCIWGFMHFLMKRCKITRAGRAAHSNVQRVWNNCGRWNMECESK